MAVNNLGSTTTITPTAWKWMLGAVAMLPFAPLSFFVSPIFLLMATGWLHRIVMTPQGITARNWWSVKQYRWQDISDFQVSKIKSSLVTTANMVKFTHEGRKNTLLGKATKALTGGTDTIPSFGLKPEKLVLLMRAYRRGAHHEDIHGVTQSAGPFVAAPIKPLAPAREEVSQVTKPARQPAVQQHRRSSKHAETNQARPHAPAKINRKPLPKPSTPLVQEGFKLFGRRPQRD